MNYSPTTTTPNKSRVNRKYQKQKNSYITQDGESNILCRIHQITQIGKVMHVKRDFWNFNQGSICSAMD